MSNFDPNQPRDDEGKWSSGGGRKFTAAGPAAKHYSKKLGVYAIEAAIAGTVAYRTAQKLGGFGDLVTHMVTGDAVTDKALHHMRKR